ncbi:hypothetical protein CLV62_13134 [Dysgonomonas alginatilytica]|uniref:MobA protein n=1 Tax=Dysgonomonas alginatilytica TaxID=1605892 RepID=A0A2V3PKY5_9BACT|nr:hypothetical protein [Dysgonomonas alginatilytica]PXV60114.1 hypothetical protein CLV62_13134 [Dysgonomonas alginatilytica]
MNRKPVVKGAILPKKTQEEQKRGRGRPKKDHCLKYRYMFRLNDSENEKFLEMYKQSKMKSKSSFVVDRVLNNQLKIIQINKSTIDFVMLLTQFFAQFRAIKNNYNQLFTTLVRNLGEDKARYMLKIVEKSTLEFIQSKLEIEELATKLKEQCLPK